MIALFAAEGAEAQALVERLVEPKRIEGPWVAHRGRLAGVEALVVETGVGKAAAAAAVGYVAARFAPDGAIWGGVAGALDPALEPGSVLIARDAVQWDVDITAFGRAPGELATGERFVQADPELTARLAEAARALGIKVRVGRVASADAFLADPARARWVREAFAADAVEMEGAAALWAARRLGLPMALVRVVTDGADDSAPGSFERFLEEASTRMARLLEATLRRGVLERV